MGTQTQPVYIVMENVIPSNETLPRLLWAQLDQRGPPHCEAKHVGHDVVDDDHHDGHDEPDEALEHVLDDEIGLGDHAEEGHVSPCEEIKLSKIIFLNEGEDEPDKPDDVHSKGDESVISNKEREKVNIVNENTKLLHQGFSIKEIVRCN